MLKATVVGFLILICVVCLYKFEVSGIEESAGVAQAAAIQTQAAVVARPANLARLKRPAVREACKKHSDWTMEACQTIDAKEVMIGMTENQVLLAWGKPPTVNVTTSSSHQHEQWVYGSGSYIYLDDGVVRTMQNSR